MRLAVNSLRLRLREIGSSLKGVWGGKWIGGGIDKKESEMGENTIL